MKRTVIIFVILLLQTMVIHAYDYPYLILQNIDGSIKPVAVESLTMSFADGLLMLQNAETEETFPLTDLNRMFFASESTSIDKASVSAEEGDVEVFSLSGIKVGRFASKDQVVKSLERGIYIVKHSNGQTQKIVIR